jgi:hypothetical protein
MQPLKAHVKNGRVVLDEPLELPEDTELEVGSLQVVDTGDDLDENACIGLWTQRSSQCKRAALWTATK